MQWLAWAIWKNEEWNGSLIPLCLSFESRIPFYLFNLFYLTYMYNLSIYVLIESIVFL